MADRKNPGHIGHFGLAGFPLALLLPIMPHNVMPDEKRDPGKSPGNVNIHGEWYPLAKWQHGVSKEELARGNHAGANCGLLMGKAIGAHQFLFIDFDTEPNRDPAHPDTKAAQLITSTALKALARFFGKPGGEPSPLWVRLTRPGRAGVLVRIPASEAAGSKSVAVLSDATTGAARGKIELLATGQQAVLGGVHPWNRGTAIRWAKTGVGGEIGPAPRLDDGVPFVASREVLNAALVTIYDALRAAGIAVTVKGSSSIHANEPLPPEERAPPSIGKLVSTLDNMPHPDGMDRDDYARIMRCAAGCIAAMRELDRLGDDGESRITDAAIGWAARWEGLDKNGDPTTEDAEREKWEGDWAKNPNDRIHCWEVIRGHAIMLGDEDLRFEVARDEFEATEDLPLVPAIRTPAPALQAPPVSDEDDFRPRPRQPGLVDVKQSDIQITDHMIDRFGSIAAYVMEEKNWIIFYGRRRGWSEPHGIKYVRNWVNDELVRYVQKHGAEWADASRAKLMSAARIDAVEKILRDRVGIGAEALNRGRGFLQTPEGAYDLATGELLKPAPQRDLLDTRLTSIAPVAGECPEFEALINHVCCDDDEVAAWLWAYLGYMLIGKPVGHVLLVIHGPGGNGKGTLDRIVQYLLGTYAKAIDRNVVLDSGKGKHETGLYDIRGARYWSVSELPANERWNEAQIRSMTGGDAIKARGMNQNMQTLQPEGSFLITTNFLPSFHRVDDAIARRFRIIHARLKPKRKDLTLEDRIKKNEAPAILARLMAEAAKVISNGYELPPVPGAMRGEASRFFNEQDQFYAWFSAECDTAKSTQDIPFDEVRSRYDAYLRRQNEGREGDDMMGGADAMPNNAFVSALRRAGAVLDDTNGRRLVRKREDGRVEFVIAGMFLKVRGLAV